MSSGCWRIAALASTSGTRSTRARRSNGPRTSGTRTWLNSFVAQVRIPPDGDATLVVGPAKREVRLTNLHKPFWPELGITKGDLIQYYADVAPVLLPHLRDRAMVMKRYPHGAHGEFFFMKRAPTPRPLLIQTCSIEHDSANVIDFPMIPH